jgi:hypothetical protein
MEIMRALGRIETGVKDIKDEVADLQPRVRTLERHRNMILGAVTLLGAMIPVGLKFWR